MLQFSEVHLLKNHYIFKAIHFQEINKTTFSHLKQLHTHLTSKKCIHPSIKLSIKTINLKWKKNHN